MVETLDNDPGRRPRSRPASPSDIEEITNDEDMEDDPQLQDVEASPCHPSIGEPTAPPPTARKAGKKRKKPLTAKQRVAIKEKLSLLTPLEPHPFIPNKSDFDVAKYEQPLRILGLWDFANVQLDREIRKDLLIELIAYYDTSGRRSFVNDTRISVARADLTRALKIPNRKAIPVEDLKDGDHDVLKETSTTSALVKFLLNWIVLAGEEVGIIPAEAQAAIESIQSGNAPKVDWAGLLWIMVEKDLSEAPKSGVCYYASHLQQLMKSQKPNLFEIDDPTAVLVPVADHPSDTRAPEARDAEIFESAEIHNLEDPATDEVPDTTVAQATDAHEMDVDATGSHIAEEQKCDVDAGEDKADILAKNEPEKQQDPVSNIEAATTEEKHPQTSVEEGQTHWLPGDSNDVPQHCLQRCTSTLVPSMDMEEGIKEEPDTVDRERCEDDFTSKFPSLDGSADLLPGMVDSTDPFFPSTRQEEEFLASRHDTDMSMSLNCGRAASPLFQDTGKRVSAEIEDEDEEEGGIRQFQRGLSNKRMRTEHPWENVPSTFNFHLEQTFGSLTKLKMAHEQNQQELMNAQMQIHYLSTALQQKEHYIQSLERSMLEEQQKRQVHFHHLEYEHNVMSRLVVGYQKALKETRQAFTAYRKRFPQGEEPLYKDAGGPGGTVLTTRELERQCLEKLELEKQQLQRRELENQIVIDLVLEFSRDWSSKFENYWDKVQQLGERLSQLKEKASLLAEKDVKTKPQPQISE